MSARGSATPKAVAGRAAVAPRLNLPRMPMPFEQLIVVLRRACCPLRCVISIGDMPRPRSGKQWGAEGPASHQQNRSGQKHHLFNRKLTNATAKRNLQITHNTPSLTPTEPPKPSPHLMSSGGITCPRFPDSSRSSGGCSLWRISEMSRRSSSRSCCVSSFRSARKCSRSLVDAMAPTGCGEAWWN